MFAPKIAKPVMKGAGPRAAKPARERPLIPLPRDLQPKLAVGSADDPLEREADRIAEQVMNFPNAGRPAIATPTQPGNIPAPRTNSDATTQSASRPLPDIVHEVLRTPGQPLDQESRVFFEPRFRNDFNNVRIHADARAAESAHSVRASAYTVGQQVVFGRDRYAPNTTDGGHLLAHELAHTLQQRSGAASLQRAPDSLGSRPPQRPALEARLQVIEETGAAVGARLDQIIRTGGPIPTNTKVIGAWIIDVEGFQGPKEIRTINGADTDTLGTGAPVFHAPTPTARVLSETRGPRTERGGRSPAITGPRRESINSHSNDAEIKGFEFIIPRLPKGAQGTIHFTTVRVRPVNGQTVLEPYPACSGCIRASFEAAGTVPEVDLVSHAPAHPSGTVEFGAPQNSPPKSAKRAARVPTEPEPTSTTTPPATETPTPTRPPPARTPESSAAPEASQEEPPARPLRVNVEVEDGAAHVEHEGGWKWVSPAAAGATVALQIYGALAMIDGALASIEKASTGSVGPKVARAMASLDRDFPLAGNLWQEKFRAWHEDANYPAARDWLIENGLQALLEKGKLLETMGDNLNTVYWYNGRLDDLEYDYDRLQRQLTPILEQVRLRTRALYDASEEALKRAAKFPNDTAQLELWGVYESLHDAAEDLSRLESQASSRLFEYKQSRDKAHTGRTESALWINYWSPVYQRVVGRKLLSIHVPEK